MCGLQYEFVASGERIAGKVMRQLRNALQPFMTEATVSWGSLVVRDAVPQVRTLLSSLCARKYCGCGARLTGTF